MAAKWTLCSHTLSGGCYRLPMNAQCAVVKVIIMVVKLYNMKKDVYATLKVEVGLNKFDSVRNTGR